MIYCYYNNEGELKETIYSRVSQSDVNGEIAVYWEGYEGTYLYANFKQGENEQDDVLQTSIAMLTIPNDPNRDYKFFKENLPYKFYIFTIPDLLRSDDKLLTTFTAYTEGGTAYSLGLLTFNVEHQVINYEPFDDRSQFAYLLHYIGTLDSRIPTEEQIESWESKVSDVLVDDVSVVNNSKVAIINNKQNKLNQNQLNAVNSGITSNLVDSAENHIANSDIHISSADRTNWNNKQDALSQQQLNATNSGIDAVKVSAYSSHITDTTKHITATERSTWNSKENASNKVSSWQTTTDNTHFPSEKLVKDSLNLIEQEISEIETLIPTSATSTNQLADKSFVNSSIASATATFKGTYDVEDDLGLTQSATKQQVASALLSVVSGATLNDYVFVVFTDHDAISRYDRYKFSNGAWVFEYTLNNSSFTAVQWASINSGITDNKVSDYDTHIEDTNNPHNVNKTQVGLGNVDNTSDANKPISTATQSALDGKQDSLSSGQLSATNSGITSTKVGNYDDHIDNSVKHITASERASWNDKQNALSTSQLNATNSGITSTKVGNYDTHISDTSIHVSSSDKSTWNSKQNALISGVNIKTINNQNILGSGNVDIQSGETYTAGYGIDIIDNEISVNSEIASYSDLENKQDKLVSGSNIKTVNGQSLLGSGNVSADAIEHREILPQPTSTSADFVGIGFELYFKCEINWDEPIQDGDRLEITQVYSADKVNDELKII